MCRSHGVVSCGVVMAALAIGAVQAAASVDSPRYAPAQRAPVAVPTQFVDARQLRIDNVVGLTPDRATPSTHRTVIAWQINAGYWNGQQLDGLSLVLVQTMSDDPAADDTAIYISDHATVAQRDALLTALSAAHPALFGQRDANCRVEPACIRVEQDSAHRMVLHVGTIA
jgi:hypothetical protein